MPLLSSPELFPSYAEICGSHTPSAVRWQLEQSVDVQSSATLTEPVRGIASKPLCGEQLVREAVLLSFCDPLPQQCLQLQHLSKKEWQKLLHWLDISGLALYFLDRIMELQLCDWLPARVLARLQQNLMDNTERTRGMIAESAAIQQEFQKARS